MLAAVTFPLIWVGGLVTTYGAGMAVPDWPGTYGYNLLLYPWESWIAGPWDLFLEHGHRLLGVLAGMLNIALVLAVFRWDRRVWLRYLSVGALVAVILQGSLGGFRVLWDDRQLAMIHGCAGPAFFALCVALCVFTSRTWKQAGCRDETAASEAGPGGNGSRPYFASLPRLTVVMLTAAFVQLIIGAWMRHIPVTASPNFFAWLVYAHLIVGGLVAVLAIVVSRFVSRIRSRLTGGRALANTLLLLVVTQLVLGCATYVVNYYWPNWVPDWALTARYAVIEAKGWWQAMIVTAHQATGSLVLGVSVWLMLRVFRRMHTETELGGVDARLAGGASA